MNETTPSTSLEPAAAGADRPASPDRLPVVKTYKTYINGSFPRSESGRTYALTASDGRAVAHVCRCSRKDARDAVSAARAGLSAWSHATPYLRGQILYRVAEMLEGRAEQFARELERQGASPDAAAAELQAAVDRVLYYAGWTDKLQQVFGAVNPVASSHFNFSLLEPTGVVALIAPEESGLLGLVAALAPILAGGNACVALASHDRPLGAVTLAEVLHTSDVPPGAVNILTGERNELVEPLAAHRDVNAIVYHGAERPAIRALREAAADNLKRICIRPPADWFDETLQDPYWILDTMEVKTTWHPVRS